MIHSSELLGSHPLAIEAHPMTRGTTARDAEVVHEGPDLGYVAAGSVERVAAHMTIEAKADAALVGPFDIARADQDIAVTGRDAPGSKLVRPCSLMGESFIPHGRRFHEAGSLGPS